LNIAVIITDPTDAFLKVVVAIPFVIGAEGNEVPLARNCIVPFKDVEMEPLTSLAVALMDIV
jgi:hypothetical protein